MHARVDSSKLNKALSGKVKTLKLTAEDQDDVSKPLVKLQFKNVKKGSGIARKLSKGKSASVKLSELNDIIDSHTGGSLFGRIKDIGKSVISSDVAKGLADKAIKTVINKGAQFVDSKTGNTGIASKIGSLAGDIASQQAQAQMEKAGSGLQQFTSLGGTAPLQFNDVRERMAHVRSFRKPKGAGFLSGLKSGAKSLAKQVAKEAVSKGAQLAAKTAADAIQQRTGIDTSGITSALANAGSQAVNQQIGSGMSKKDRMAWVRSHKGKRGGSFKSFSSGGSFSQL